MKISYDNLWKLLIDKKMNKTELCKLAELSTSTMAKMSKNEPVSIMILIRICEKLDCQINDVITFVKNDVSGGFNEY
jgi:DNA-binding Xre family transcriptional regulator